MPGSTLAVAVTRRLPPETESRLAALYRVRLNPEDEPLDGAALAAHAAGADVLVPTVTDRLDAEALRALPASCRLIANFGAGVDHIDLAAAAVRGMAVTNTSDVLTEDTADLAMALMLCAPRRLGEGERLVRAGAWPGWAPTFMPGRRVSGKRLGIVGLGRIGRAVARRARGFSMSVHYHNRNRCAPEVEAALEAAWRPDLDRMLAEMDFVSINCPHTPETHRLFDAARLALLAPHAVLVNTARGGIVDEAALAARLASGALAGAGLDVFAREPAVEEALLGLENVVLSPHLGSATREGRAAMGERVLANIAAFAAGDPPPDRVAAGAG